MKKTITRFKLSALTLAILGGGSTSALYAQEAEVERKPDTTVKQASKDTKDKNEDEDGLEVITVSGFRGSLLKAMSEKRNTTNVSDSIFAEDIGKSTDQNIADALSRVTGVSVQSVDGEGTQISVRGANSSQNMITLNGVQLTSADFNQAVDLSSFSSDILSSISVIKTPSADHDEGSLGASVRLVTTKPLDIAKDRRSLTFQGRYNDFSENEDSKISGTFSQKFFDDTFGFIITASSETNSVRRDEMVIPDFQKRDLIAAKDQHGNILTNLTMLGPTAVNYNLFQNNRDRDGVNTSIQWLPTDSTNVILDVNYSRFTGTDVSQGVTVRDVNTESTNYQAGVPNDELLDGVNYVPGFDDPHAEWTTVNTDTLTIEKQLRRFGDGGYNTRNGSSDTTNTQISLRIEQELTDDLRFEVGANTSETTLRPDPSFTTNLLGGGNDTRGRILAGPESDPHTGIQPAGYDCTSGVCNLVFGDGMISEQDPFNKFDSISRTAWNPDDLDAHRTNTFNLLDRKVDDFQSTFYIDFDWDLDFAGITQVEFGAKYRKRKKTTDDQSFRLNNTAESVGIPRFDADGNIIGEILLREGISLADIPPSQYITDSPFPYDNFMSDLGARSSSLTDGWSTVDVNKLQELALNEDNLELIPNPGDFRETELKHTAVYAKINYEYLEGKLTGDLGVRYIKTVSTSVGSSDIDFYGANLSRAFDPFLFRTLRDVTLPECQLSGRPRPFNNQNSIYSRIDGNGWDLSGDTPVPIPINATGYPCHDPLALTRNNNGWVHSRHGDISRHGLYIFDDGDLSTPEDRSNPSFITTGGNEYDMFLPSLNLNYQIQDDLIGRFAISKTISRANIDSLRPGFTLTENIWAPHDAASGNLTLFNSELMPQESKNLDLSLEWYFNKTGLLSAAFFFKDMSNFEEEENALVYTEDVRHVDFSNGYDVANLILTEEQVRAGLADPNLIDGVGKGACMPDRGTNGNINQDWFFDETDLTSWCSQFNASRLRNGKGAEIKGIELGYQQNYDFLPGVLSGLGVQMNYTYQSSKTDPEFSSFNETELLPQFPQARTPEHSYNATLFWEKWGHQIRVAFRGQSDELIQRSWNQGALWREGSTNLDFSAAYKISQNVRVSFQAINLTDEVSRNYYTSRTVNLGTSADPFIYDEGNPLEDSSVTKSRTQSLSKTGRTFRIDLRVDF